MLIPPPPSFVCFVLVAPRTCRRYLEICTLLVDAGAAVDTADIEGWTPTLTALDVGAWQIAIALLNCGASVNQVRACGVVCESLPSSLYFPVRKGKLPLCV